MCSVFYEYYSILQDNVILLHDTEMDEHQRHYSKRHKLVTGGKVQHNLNSVWEQSTMLISEVGPDHQAWGRKDEILVKVHILLQDTCYATLWLCC